MSSKEKFNLDIKANLILEVVQSKPLSSSKEIHELLSLEIGYATVKRIIQNLLAENLLLADGKGKSTRYRLSPAYKLFYPVDLETYFEKEIDERKIKSGFNFQLLQDVLNHVSIFTDTEIKKLNTLQNHYSKKITELSVLEYKKELERLAIDLSWKSSQIEGNTYSLLETERLLKEKETAAGKTKDEAIMLLNHKEALDFIVENPTFISPLRIAGIESIHSLLTKELNVERNIRKRSVGITGTNYRPLDNEFQIREALDSMCALVNKQDNVFSSALLTLLLISYIQPFVDGNKRTGRIVSNAILINKNHCPLSFRTVDSVEYKKALLLFYEQNNLSAFKGIFINQFEFAVNTYF
jgi:predicted transcriptional regulator